MSERDESGQFSSAEPVYGREGLERDAGYAPLPEEKNDSDDLTVAEAAEQLSSTPESEIRTHSAIPDLEDNVSMTLEQGAKALSDMNEADQLEADGNEADKIRAEVDALRGTEAQPVKPIEDLTPEKVLEHPVFKETFDKLTSETEAARQTYQANLEAATRVATTSFVSQFPEFANVPAEQYPAIMALMAQHNPDRATAIQTAAANMGHLFEQHSAESKRTAEQAQAKLQTYVKTESDRFEKMIANTANAERSEIENGIVAKIKEYGGDIEAFKNLMTKSEFSSATVQRLLWDVGKLHRIENTKRAVATRSVPQVQRPGVARLASSGDSGKIQAAQDKFNRTGSLKDAQAYYALQSSKRRA